MIPQILLSILLCIINNINGLTPEQFIVFKADVEELMYVNPNNLGLTAFDPRVTIFDFGGQGPPDVPIQAGLIRLIFHDCAGMFLTQKGKKGFIGGCDGCINIDNIENDELFDSALSPLQSICDTYNSLYGLSIADCWALAGTIAVEGAANRTKIEVTLVVSTAEQRFVAVEENEIGYYIGRKDCSTAPFTDNIYEFPDALNWGWNLIEPYFKDRFDMTTQDIVALVVGAHSVGRMHQNISGYTGIWDFTTDVLDFAWVSRLLNEDLDTFSFFNNFPGYVPQQTSFRQTIINPNPPSNAKQQWCFDFNEFVDNFAGLTSTLGTACLQGGLNTDISLVYDLSWYHENGLSDNIDCVTDASVFCNSTEEIILTAKRGNDGINGNKNLKDEINECPQGKTCCSYIQCPIQCKGGMKRYNKLIDKIDDIRENIDCPAIYAKKYSHNLSLDSLINQRKMGLDFIQSFRKMITVGYTKPNGDITLQKIDYNPDTFNSYMQHRISDNNVLNHSSAVRMNVIFIYIFIYYFVFIVLV